jgi:hypothetical protein
MRDSPVRDPAVLRVAFEFCWRTFLIGLALFIVPPFAAAPTPEQQAIAFIAAVVWCYYDGALWRYSWPTAVLEGAVWFFCAAKWAQALVLFFGVSEVV